MTKPGNVRFMDGEALEKDIEIRDRASKIEHLGATALRNGTHILSALLIVVGLGSSARAPLPVFAVSCILLLLWGFVYFYGNDWREGATHLQQLVWLLLLSVIWVVMLPIVPVSLYMVFPLFFMYLEIMPDVRGLIAVFAGTAIAIVSQYPHGLTIGGVMGPIVYALITIAIDYAFRTLYKVNQENQKLIDELIETRSQLAETERAAGIADERQRIAHEIHDTLAQGLSSIQMLLHVAEEDLLSKTPESTGRSAALTKIDLARSTASDNLSEARAMIGALQPATLTTTSLEQALHRVVQPIINVDFVINVEGDERQLPMRTEATLLRVAQGAIGNVAKHSKAKNCHITLTYEEDQVRLDVVDDGAGFDPEKISQRPASLGHIGLNAMKQRAAELGGELIVESSPGNGTAVSVALPVEISAE